MQSHAACPQAFHLSEDCYRIFFGTRDRNQRPHIAYLDYCLRRREVISLASQAVLTPGPRGYFDDNGAYPGSVLVHGGRVFLYYMGRSNGEGNNFRMAIGLAVSEDRGSTFHRLSPAPIMAQSPFDPWMVTLPCVRKEKDLWRMWYVSGLGWRNEDTSEYHIKYAESYNGLEWQREGQICVDFERDESNLAAPSVLYDGGKYRMWYCVASSSAPYRLGYAHSEDGKNWTREDGAVGIPGSTDEWDSESMAYPHVFEHRGRKVMLYSGNACGRDGIGIAVEENE